MFPVFPKPCLLAVFVQQNLVVCLGRLLLMMRNSFVSSNPHISADSGPKSLEGSHLCGLFPLSNRILNLECGNHWGGVPFIVLDKVQSSVLVLPPRVSHRSLSLYSPHDIFWDNKQASAKDSGQTELS
jgi:hypothetical protein